MGKSDRIGHGSWGEVYHVQECATGQDFAAKLEDVASLSTLPWEAEVLNRVRGLPGFPAVHYCDTEGDKHVMLMDLLGRNLSDLHQTCGGRFTLRTVLMIA